MSNLTELTAQIIAARAAKKEMSREELHEEMNMVYSFLKGIEEGNVPASTPEPAEIATPKLSLKQAFKKDEVICLICNKGFTTLKKHLFVAHDMKPGDYKKQFNIPAKQSLAAKNYVESRRQMAIDKGLGEGLAKARAKRAANATEKKVKVSVPAVKRKASVPAKDTKK